jgi:hypothetical protein
MTRRTNRDLHRSGAPARMQVRHEISFPPHTFRALLEYRRPCTRTGLLTARTLPGLRMLGRQEPPVSTQMRMLPRAAPRDGSLK